MLNKNDILNLIKKYNLDNDEIKIISGAAMVLHGLKEKTNDLDISVSLDMYNYLLDKYPCKLEKKDVFYIDDVINFSHNYYDVDTIKYHNCNVQTVKSILELKNNLNRDKDKLDISKILENNNNNLELEFSGRGAMLYPSEGNTSCIFKDTFNTFIIDAGSDVATKLIADKTLDSDSEFYFLNTHTHCDHIGSIGIMIQYLYYKKNKILNIIYDDNMLHLDKLLTILECMGIEKNQYRLIKSNTLTNKFSKFNDIKYKVSNHGDTPLDSSSIVIESNNGDILYTGDIADTKVIENFINKSNNIDKIFVDVSLTKSPVHISLDDLKFIKDELKSKIWAMHINDKILEEKTKELGFNIVKVKKSLHN